MKDTIMIQSLQAIAIGCLGISVIMLNCNIIELRKESRTIDSATVNTLKNITEALNNK